MKFVVKYKATQLLIQQIFLFITLTIVITKIAIFKSLHKKLYVNLNLAQWIVNN